MNVFKLSIFIVISVCVGSSFADACDKAKAKSLLQIPFDTVGLRSMSQVEAVRGILGCGNEADGPFAQAFLEVTGENLQDFASRSGGGPSVSVNSVSRDWDSLTPESELNYKTAKFSIDDAGVQVIQVPVEFDEVELIEVASDKPSIELTFASDRENQSNLDAYVGQFGLGKDSDMVKIQRSNRSGYCMKITKNFEFRMGGICLLKAVVNLPRSSEVLIIDENGVRVNDSDLPISKAEFFNALSEASLGDEIVVVRQYVKNRKPQEKLSVAEALSILSEVSMADEFEALELIIPVLQTPLAPNDLGKLVDEVSMSDELEAFKLLAPLVSLDRRMDLLEVIDDELGMSDEKKARRFLMEMSK